MHDTCLTYWYVNLITELNRSYIPVRVLRVFIFMFSYKIKGAYTNA